MIPVTNAERYLVNAKGGSTEETSFASLDSVIIMATSLTEEIHEHGATKDVAAELVVLDVTLLGIQNRYREAIGGHGD